MNLDLILYVRYNGNRMDAVQIQRRRWGVWCKRFKNETEQKETAETWRTENHFGWNAKEANRSTKPGAISCWNLGLCDQVTEQHWHRWGVQTWELSSRGRGQVVCACGRRRPEQAGIMSDTLRLHISTFLLSDVSGEIPTITRWHMLMRNHGN